METSWSFQDNPTRILLLISKNPALPIFEEFNDYIQSANQFSDKILLIQDYCELANENNKLPNPLDI